MPQQPWKRLHLDFAGPFEGQMWPIIVERAPSGRKLLQWPPQLQKGRSTFWDRCFPDMEFQIRLLRTTVETSKPEWISCIHPQKKNTLHKTSQIVKYPLREMLVNYGDAVWMQNYQKLPTWIPGSITTKFGPRNYQVLTNGKFHKRHIDQLRTRSLDTLEDTSHKFLDFPNV